MIELSWNTLKRIIEHKEDASYGLEWLEMVFLTMIGNPTSTNSKSLL